MSENSGPSTPLTIRIPPVTIENLACRRAAERLVETHSRAEKRRRAAELLVEKRRRAAELLVEGRHVRVLFLRRHAMVRQLLSAEAGGRVLPTV